MLLDKIKKTIEALSLIHIFGAGLAGSEAAWQLAKRGIKVDLYEMRPKKMTPAHKTQNFAELVCSNSLRANNITNAVGCLLYTSKLLREKDFNTKRIINNSKEMCIRDSNYINGIIK